MSPEYLSLKWQNSSGFSFTTWTQTVECPVGNELTVVMIQCRFNACDIFACSEVYIRLNQLGESDEILLNLPDLPNLPNSSNSPSQHG